MNETTDKPKAKKAILKSDLIDKTWGYEEEKVQVFMMTRRPKLMRFRHRSKPPDKQLELYKPMKTEYGSNYYMMSIAAFKKYKGGEWDKYFLGSDADCMLNIEVSNGRGGTELREVYPVVEQVVKNPNTNKFEAIKNYQGLPVLIDVFDERKDSELKEKYHSNKSEIKV